MTLTEAYNHVDNQLDKSGTDYFIDAVKNEFFIRAAFEFVETKLTDYEKDQEARDDLRTLISDPQTVNVTASSFPIPSDYYRLLSLHRDNGIPIRLIQISDLKRTIQDPDATPIFDDPIAYQTASKINIQPQALGNVQYIYCVKPILGANGNSEFLNLPEPSQMKVLLMAIRMMEKSTGGDRYQLDIAEQQILER